MTAPAQPTARQMNPIHIFLVGYDEDSIDLWYMNEQIYAMIMGW